MHAYTTSHRTARHTRHLPSAEGGLDDAHQFWPVRRLATWTSGDHHRHGKRRAQHYPPALLTLGNGARR